MEKENLKSSKFDRLCESFSNFSFFGPSRYLIYKQTSPINNSDLSIQNPDFQKSETQINEETTSMTNPTND